MGRLTKKEAASLAPPRSWREKVADIAADAMEDVRKMLEYEDREIDGRMQKVSKISEQERGRLNRFLMQMHPENVAHAQNATVELKIDFGDVRLADAAAKEAERRTIDVKAEPQ